MSSQDADLFVDVTDTMARKVAARRARDSQTSRMDDLEGLLRGWGTTMAEAAGMASDRLAEGFRVVTTR
jgi:hypothetical protein